MDSMISMVGGEGNRRIARAFRCLLIAAGIFLLGIGLSAQTGAQAKAKYYKIQGKWVGFEKATGRLTWSAGIDFVPKKIAGTKVKILGKWCYNKNKNIKDITIPSSVKKIEKGAFYGCPNLKRIVLPKGIKLGDIEDNRIFWESNYLETVVNNPDEKWKARMETFYQTLTYLQTQDPKYFVDNVRSFKNQWIVDKDGKHVDYTDEAWAVVTQKAEELTKGCSTDMAKAKAISKWIVGYLHYDDKWMEKFQEWRKTHDEDTEEFPIKKVTDAYGLITWDPAEHDGETAMTTCGGYGNLTQALFAAAGIPCVHVHREQKAGENIDHVFNVAYIDGKWRWLDNTYSDKNLDYFDCAIAGFSASDHRCDRLNLVDLSELLSGARPSGAAGFSPAERNVRSGVTGRDDSTLATLTTQANDTEYVTVDGLRWGIDRSKSCIAWFPRDWDGQTIPTELDGMKVTMIGEYACQNRDTIRELVIPEGIIEIGDGAFRGCQCLAKLTLPASVKKLGNYAFSSCDELETIIYTGDKKQIKFGNYVYSDDYCMHPDFSDAYKKGIYYKQLNEVKLSGDFSDDMIAIGRSQLGYHQGNDESEMHGYNKLGGEYYSEYNYFTGMPDWQWGMKGLVKQSDYEYGYGGWCGNYCEWCMCMAGLPHECSGYFGHKNVVKWKDTIYTGGTYEIKAGDIMHMSAGHYTMVVSVRTDGDKVKVDTLNGNPDVDRKTYVLNIKDGKNEESHNYDFDELYPLDEAAAADVKTFTVSFDADGGSGGVTSKKVYEGASYGVLPKPVKSGFTFDGWYTEKNGGGKKITAYRNVWPDGDFTVYANWLPGDEPLYLDIDTYVSKAPEHSSIMDQFARIYITKGKFTYAEVKKKSQKTRIKRMNGKGKMSFKNVTEGAKKKYIKIANNGVVTIKKGAPRGTYAIHVTVEKYRTVNMSQSTVYIEIK